MPIDIATLVERTEPERTLLLFGAGSSVPSHGPTSPELVAHLGGKFKLPVEGFSLSELAGLVEQNYGRRELIDALRDRIKGLRPTGGLLNLPLYDWKSIYTTNYDDLIEQCYKRHSRDLIVYASDFDFVSHGNPIAANLFKLHGTIEKDLVDGFNFRIVITESDYDNSANYREKLYDRLKNDLNGSHLIIVGHSLADPDIRDIINRAQEIGAKSGSTFQINLLLYTSDTNRAQLYEKRGMTVCFGGIDQLLSGLARKLSSHRTVRRESRDPLDLEPILRAETTDVDHASQAVPEFSSMFNGWPAEHADILAGLTFDRSVSEDLATFLTEERTICALLLGASGVGKTTAARQVLQRLRKREFIAWEHQGDYSLHDIAWLRVARVLTATKTLGVLLIDDAHSHLQDINELVDKLVAENLYALKLLCVSTRNHWDPRIKSPYIFKYGRQFTLSRLQPEEIERLLTLVEVNATIRPVVENTFSGFSRYERKRRLTERCQADMFVCLKNIFASEKFDDILLREYANLDPAHQDIYRHVAAMESAGIRVHRQLVIRLLGIPTAQLAAILQHLTDIVHEYTINAREGLYGWKTRHSVIASLIAHYKFPDLNKRVDLFSRVIDNISPTYDIEVRTIRELCNIETGVSSIPDKKIQNTLLRKMMSAVPGERIPRHRLIRNLIGLGEFEKADTEIRIFEKDFKRDDGPIARYKVNLLKERAMRTPGILQEDRITILGQARALAENSIQRFQNHKSLLAAYCEVGIELFRLTKDSSVANAAIAELRAAEERIGDPDIARLIGRYEAQIGGDLGSLQEAPEVD